MKRVSVVVIVLVCSGVAAAGGYWLGHRGSAEHAQAEAPAKEGEAEHEDKPVVSVQVAPMRRGTIAEAITAYGSVMAEPGEVRVLTVPFESRIARLRVIPGQAVAADAELADIEASPDALIALQEARNAVEVAARDLKQTQQRFEDHLATNVELSQAQQASQTASLKLETLTKRGVDQSQKLKSPVAGIVSKVDAQEGQIVAAGASIVQVAATNRVEVRLGVEPGDVEALKVGDAVKLHPPGQSAGESIVGTVRTIGQRVDPATRLVEVRVGLPQGSHLLLDSFIAGEFARGVTDALIVPRDAALPAENGEAALFTVKDAHAVKHVVQLGLQNDRDVQVIADGLKGDEVVVTSGNNLLEDGMQVEVEQPAAAKSDDDHPATKPSAAPATTESKS